MDDSESTAQIDDSYKDIFRRFLKFGFLAWGGPVAQIDMIRQELVEEEKWISQRKFNRVLGVYQALPGPEAHELCVYFGMVAKGRLGGLLAGLGFMLPGFILMFLLSWFYVSFGISSSLFASIFLGVQAAVIALIFRATHKIGRAVITDYWLLSILVLSVAGELLGIHFLITLTIAGLIYLFLKKQKYFFAATVTILFLAGMVSFALNVGTPVPSEEVTSLEVRQSTPEISTLTLFFSGLRSGLLTFGGAYTVIPFLRHDAVQVGQWMTDAEFVDGLGLSGVLPAPLVIFGTFVGYLGGGALGALATTLGIFLPAFGFTLLFHNIIETISHHPSISEFLYGVTAGVVGIIAVTAVDLFRVSIINGVALSLFLLSLLILYTWKSKANVPVAILGAGLLGFALKFLVPI